MIFSSTVSNPLNRMAASVFASSNTIRKTFLSWMLAGLISLGLLAISQPSYASEQSTAQTAPDAAAVQEREQTYEQAKEIAEDPKMGVEKEYEQEVEAYRKAHGGKGGIVEKAKDLVTDVTGK